MFKRIISFVLVIAIVFCFAVPSAFAATEYYSKSITYGDALLTGFYNYADDVWDEDSPLPFIGTAIKGIATSLNGKICEKSHNGYHASLGESISHEAFGKDEHGRYCLLSCDYCGEWFRCYSSDLIAAHDEYVNGLDSVKVGYTPSNGNYLYNGVELPSINSVWVDKQTYPYAIIRNYAGDIDLYLLSFDLYYESNNLQAEYKSKAKRVQYRLTENVWYDYWGVKTETVSGIVFSESSPFTFWSSFDILNADGTVYLAGSEPASTEVTYDELLYPVETRTGSLMQTINNYNVDNSVVDNSSNINYYISPKSYVTELPDDTIDIEQCYSPQSYDEETLVFTEPVTGAQILTSGWTYNYETRTYDIDVPSGTTTDSYGVDITRIELIYGDEAVTYNYYLADDTLAQSDEYAYVMVSGDENFGTGGSSEEPDEPEDPSEAPEEETHKHSYTSTVTTDPTCEAPGIRKYTCDECGDSYTEKIDATGHTWTVKQSVATEYDDTGAVTVQGYTIYKCSVCNTEYKDDAGTGPPNNSADNTDGEGIFKKIGQLLGSILSGLLSMIEAVLGSLLDGLVRLADLVGDKLTQVVEIVTGLFDKIPQLFGGFTALLADVFVFIPEDIVTIFTFGAAAIVFVGILMFFIKR